MNAALARKPKRAVTTETYTYPISESGTVEILTTETDTLTVFPLTTLFVPPSSCFAPTYTVATDPFNTADEAENDQLYDYYYSSGTETVMYRAFRSECYPPFYPRGSVSPYTYTNSVGSINVSPEYLYPAQTTYSPGLCPAGYTTAASAHTGLNTLGTCCPSGYDAADGEDCSTLGGSVTVVNGTSTSIQSIGTIYASSIAIAYQSTDMSVLAQATATLSITSTSAGTSSPTPTAITSTSSPSPTDGGSSLTTGDKIGIGIGVGLGVPLLIGAGILAFFIVRKKKRSAVPSYIGGSSGYQPSERKSMREVDQRGGPYEIEQS